MLEPEYLEIKALYRNPLGEKRSILISVYTSEKGTKTHFNVTTTGQEVGDFIVNGAAELQLVADFSKECAGAFEQLIKVNKGFTKEQA